MSPLQTPVMLFDPHTGRGEPYPNIATRWRSNRGGGAAAKWLFNPWTGAERTSAERFTDPYGAFVVPGQANPGELK